MEKNIKIQYETYRLSMLTMLLTQYNILSQDSQTKSGDIMAQMGEIKARAYAWNHRIYPLFDANYDIEQSFDLFNDDCFTVPKNEIEGIHKFIFQYWLDNNNSFSKKPLKFYDLIDKFSEIERWNLYSILVYFKLQNHVHKQMGDFFDYVCKDMGCPSEFNDLSSHHKAELFNMSEIEK